jgi:hypothetical protein
MAVKVYANMCREVVFAGAEADEAAHADEGSDAAAEVLDEGSAVIKELRLQLARESTIHLLTCAEE